MPYPFDSLSPEMVGEIVRDAAKTHYGFGGNCAAFAVVLNRVLGGDGGYVIVDGGHYEFADHVAVEVGGHVFDADGLTTREALLDRWGGGPDDDDGEPSTVEDFEDASSDGESVRRLADDAGGFGPRLDEAKLEVALRAALEAAVAAPRP